MEIALLNGAEQLLARIAQMVLCPYGNVTEYRSAASLAAALKLQPPDLICLTDDVPAADMVVVGAMATGCPLVRLGHGIRTETDPCAHWLWPLGPEQVCAKLAELDIHCTASTAGLDVEVVRKLVRAMGNDAVFVVDEIDRYFAMLPERLREFSNLTRQRQSETVHQLTSISAMYGLQGVAALFLQLEYVLRNAQTVRYDEWRETLWREMERGRQSWLMMRGELSGNGPN